MFQDMTGTLTGTFDSLLPEIIFQSVRNEGWYPSGRLICLNSYENRVYEIGLEDHEPVVAKFYRPGRWSLDQLVDEHRLVDFLSQNEFPVVGALPLAKSNPRCPTLAEQNGFYYSIYPKFRGREKDELFAEDRRWVGRLMGRLHRLTNSFKMTHRHRLDVHTYGHTSFKTLLSSPFLPADLKASIETIVQQALILTEKYFDKDTTLVPVHGDCHLGNILWNQAGPHFVDFDDCCLSYPIQDLWMMFVGNKDEQKKARDEILEGYHTFHTFDIRTLSLIEPLRTLRMLRYSAWIGERYDEPIFKKTFPYYSDHRYWEKFLQDMREQIALLQEGSSF